MGEAAAVIGDASTVNAHFKFQFGLQQHPHPEDVGCQPDDSGCQLPQLRLGLCMI